MDRKLSAVVFEKMPIMGGSSVLCGGMIAVSDTDEQKAQNIKDSHDLFVKDLIVSGGGYADEKVVRAYVSAIREHYEWLTKKLGLKPDAIVLQGSQSVARSHHFSPSKILMAMADYAKKGGADIRTKCAVERLIWSSDMKKIEGVRVKTGEKTITVRAKKGVLLAAGGFSSNPTLLGRHNPPLKNAAVIAGKGTQGDGILMGLSAPTASGWPRRRSAPAPASACSRTTSASPSRSSTSTWLSLCRRPVSAGRRQSAGTVSVSVCVHRGEPAPQ